MSTPILQTVTKAAGTLTFLGDKSQGGSYVLRLQASRMLDMAFGRFKAGKIIRVEPGDYLYVGSALSERGATCLAKRLIRHATRCTSQRPHRIRRLMLEWFPQVGLGVGNLRPPEAKQLRWNIDHLLDQLSVELIAAYLLRLPERVERELGQFLENDSTTQVFERGLGANDVPGNTHILRARGGEDWWQELPEKLADFMRQWS